LQINIDKKTGILLSIIGALLISIVIVASAGMGNSGSEKDDMGMMGGHGHNSNSQMVGSDAMFLQMMIPHHEQAVVMSDHMVMMIENSPNSEIKNLGQAIVKSQSTEINLMKELLNRI